MNQALDSEQLARCWDFTAHFAGRLAHDLSNIFTGVNGFTELALFQMAADHPARAHLRDVQQSGQRGTALSQHLHLLRTCTTPPPAETTLAIALEHAEMRLRPIVATNWQADLPANLPAVVVGLDALVNILVQLLANAAEADDAVNIRIGATVVELDAKGAGELLGRAGAGRYVELTIRDRGTGLAPNAVSQALSLPMFSTKPGHRGLGLAIVFRTLYANGGGFRLDPAPDRGTVARTYLPLAEQGSA